MTDANLIPYSREFTLGILPKRILFIFTSLKYSNVRLPPNRNMAWFYPIPSVIDPFLYVKVFKFTFKVFIAKTLLGSNEDIERCVKL